MTPAERELKALGEREARLRLLAEMGATHQYSGPAGMHFDESMLAGDLRWLLARVEKLEKAHISLHERMERAKRQRDEARAEIERLEAELRRLDEKVAG